MTPKRHRQIERLYQEALGLPAGTERAAFLETACAGDEALLREVASLLRANAEASRVSKTLAGAFAANTVAAPQGRAIAGRTLRQYQIRSLAGVGGIGEPLGALV